MLLLDATNSVVEGIIECNRPVLQNGEPVALRKVSVTRVVLSAAGARVSQLSGPPGITWGDKAATRALWRQWNKDLLGTEQR